MKYLIPPSEGKSKIQSKKIKFKDTDFIFESHIEQIVTLLELIDEEDLTSIYGTSEEKSLAFHRQNQDIFNSSCAHAIERYTGIVYKNLNWDSFSKTEKTFMDKHFYIFSGLFGMVTPLTLIPEYKLKMNVLSLDHHWKDILTNALKDEDVVVDLLPQVHRKAYKAGSNVKRISFGKGLYGTPVWSPRGDLIAFTKVFSGRFYIGVMTLYYAAAFGMLHYEQSKGNY